MIHDVAIQRLPVVMCLDRGGLVGEDGATHHGAFDLAYFGTVPNLTVAAPMNELELRNMMFTALEPVGPSPSAIRAVTERASPGAMSRSLRWKSGGGVA